MLLDMGFVEDEAELAAHFPAFCVHPDGLLLGAFEDERLLGYAAVQDYGSHIRSGSTHRTAKLHDLYTAPGARRRGVARALMRGVEAWACARLLRYVFWNANTREAGPAYERMGYTAADAGQEGYLFFEIDLGNPATCIPHPERGS